MRRVVSAAVTGLASGDLGLALKAGFISMATAFAFQGVGDITSGGGFQAGQTGHSSIFQQYGPPMHLCPASGCQPIQLPGIVITSAPPAAVPTVGQNLLQGTIYAIPGAYLSGLALQEFRAGNYVSGTLYTGASLLDAAMLGVGTKVTGPGAVIAGQAGRFGNLRGIVGDSLTAHHMPQAALGFTSYADGGALVLTQAEHTLTRTYGVRGALTAEQDAGVAFRDVLTLDIRDIRALFGSRYNQGMRDLLDYYRANHPRLMAKDTLK